MKIFGSSAPRASWLWSHEIPAAWDILPRIENPVTGRLVSTAERHAQALTAARRAEEMLERLSAARGSLLSR
jgi:hypothetical protein